MRRALLLCLGIAAITWLEFEVFPGHTYLQGATQIYVPMLERLDTPGYLSRDLVATNPQLTYTIYDEVTLFLHEGCGLRFETALLAQQVLCRAAALTGIFLLVLAAGWGDIFALAIAAWFNLGAVLPGPAALLDFHEAIPRAFGFDLVLLAMGLTAREKPLLAGLTGGLALIYDPVVAAPFWIVLLLGVSVDRKLRLFLRPMLTILLVFVLLLANLAQLQPGVTDTQPVFARLSPAFAELQKFRAGCVWVGLWTRRDIWEYLALCICGLWAVARIWPRLSQQMRWMFIGLPLCGILSVAFSAVFLDELRWAVIARMEPAQMLLYTVGIALVACAIAGLFAASVGKWRESFAWFLVVAAIPINVEVFGLLSPGNIRSAGLTLLWIALAACLTLALSDLGARKRQGGMLAVPICAALLFRAIGVGETAVPIQKSAIEPIVRWAQASTWGSSMFLFPDAGRELYPGVFRAESRRAVWVDWKSGVEVRYSEAAGIEWWHRWRDTMQSNFSPGRLETLLSLPIDYYVLKSSHRLASIQPVFATSQFVVYDARDLREFTSPLQFARNRIQ